MSYIVKQIYDGRLPIFIVINEEKKENVGTFDTEEEANKFIESLNNEQQL